METSPAPFEGLRNDEGLDEFRIASPREIQLLLKPLLDGAVTLSLSARNGKVLRTCLWSLDAARGTIGFNADTDDPALQAVLAAPEVVVTGHLDGVKLQFDVRGLELVKANGNATLDCAAPRAMYRFQRRNAFRVRPIMRSSPAARVCHPAQPEVELALRVLDVSVGGCGVFVPEGVPLLEVGTRLLGVRIELDPDTQFEANILVQHVTAGADGRGARVGLEFQRIDGTALRSLQRYIELTQKRAKLMALG